MKETQGKRIVLSTFGSFGDIHPYIAVALELQRRGHRPVIATSEIYREKTDAVGLELQPLPPDLPSYDRPEEVSRIVSELMDAKKGTEKVFKELVLPYLRETYDALAEATRGADLLVTHPLTLVGPPLVEKTGIRWVSSVLAPISFFSTYDPPVPPQMPALYHLLKLSPHVGRAFMRLAELQLKSYAEPVYRFRASLGLPPRAGHPILEGQHSPTLVLALFSRVLAEPQPDWPRPTRVTGFPFYDRRDRAGDAPELDPELRRFLDEGPPPVVFTLGSSAIWVAEDFYRESVKAAQALGERALLLIGEERNHPGALPAGVAAFDYAPYSEVLPRARAVVHQGGVGTTGQGLRAGVPSLIVPFSHDQFDNAARVARLGAGRGLPRKNYHARSAERELRLMLRDKSYAARAAEVGRLVRSEDGAASASDAIEEVLRG
ncbi:MAG TPA: nucleotide disphospho-sugar-binding domain-containing protein [Pyrinomonadaceae bacterium]|nr:nucleotide disphospho-sugar-binding domain-containing protein [Pyrinomonadaceae bacterium]